MRYLVGLCLFALAVPVLASDPGGPNLALAPLTSWEGKYSDELIAALGKPKKTKPDGEGGKVLVYRLRFYGKQSVGETKIGWNATGVGTSPGQSTDSTLDWPAVIFDGGPEVIATQKVKFYVDRLGVVQRQEVAPRKWKKKP